MNSGPAATHELQGKRHTSLSGMRKSRFEASFLCDIVWSVRDVCELGQYHATILSPSGVQISGRLTSDELFSAAASKEEKSYRGTSQACRKGRACNASTGPLRVYPGTDLSLTCLNERQLRILTAKECVMSEAQPRKAYTTDLSNEQWAIIEPIVSKDRRRSPRGRRLEVCVREVVN